MGALQANPDLAPELLPVALERAPKDHSQFVTLIQLSRNYYPGADHKLAEAALISVPELASAIREAFLSPLEPAPADPASEALRAEQQSPADIAAIIESVGGSIDLPAPPQVEDLEHLVVANGRENFRFSQELRGASERWMNNSLEFDTEDERHNHLEELRFFDQVDSSPMERAHTAERRAEQVIIESRGLGGRPPREAQEQP
ncbi:MAG: hypothetical protein AAF236_05010 [Verrucomicrobiota bacterium]